MDAPQALGNLVGSDCSSLRVPPLTRTMTTAPSPAFHLCWAPTGTAAQRLGLSADTLRRYTRIGVFQPGEHYRPGLHANSPWAWDVDACGAALLRLGAERIS